MTEKKISAKRSYGIAVGLVLIAIAWFTNLGYPDLWPSRISLAQTKDKAATLITHGHGQEALALTDATLKWAPLDWQLYYQRGTARILERRDWAASLLDYQRANHLERSSPLTPENQGLAWLSYRPELAALPWAETLRRMPFDEANRKYARFLELASPYPRLLTQIEAWAGSNIARIIIQMNYAEKKRFDSMLTDFLKKNPRLDQLRTEDQRALFDVWVGKGNPAEALAALENNPSLLPNCNIPLASAKARMQRYQEACALAFSTLPVPQFPTLEPRASEVELSKEFYSQNSLRAGMTLYEIQIRRKDNYAALSTLERLQTMPSAPLYLRYLEAQLLAENGNWEKAWFALDDYIVRNRL